MANPVYSVRIFRGIIPGAGFLNSLPCPAGFRWVIRSVSAHHTSSIFGQSVPTLDLYAVDVQTTFIMGTGTWLGGHEPYYYDGHQIVEPGEHLMAVSASTDWEFSVSGYQLSLP